MVKHKRIKLTITILTTLATTLIASVWLDVYRLTSATGLPSNTINDFWQDQNGYMWMATKSDVCRYDGYSFVNFYRYGNANKLMGDTAHDALWICYATYNYSAIDLKTFRYLKYTQPDSARTFNKCVLARGGLWLYDNGHGARLLTRSDNNLHYTDYNTQNKKLASDAVRRIAITGNGRAWMSTDKGIYMVDSTGQASCLKADVRSPDVLEIGGKVFFLDNAQKIHAYSKAGKHLFTAPLHTGSPDINDVKEVFAWHGILTLLTENHAYVFNPSTCRMTLLVSDILQGFVLDKMDGYTFVQDKDYVLWIFCPTGEIKKLSLVPNSVFTHSHRRKYMVRRMHDGRFAIATYGNGLFCLNPSDFSLEHHVAKDADDLIVSNYLERLYVDSQGSLWINESQTGITFVSQSPGQPVTFVYPTHDMADEWPNNVCMLSPTRDGGAMVGTRDNKLYRMNGRTHVLTFVKKLNAPAYCYYEDNGGHQWLGTRGDGLYVDGVRYATDEPVYQGKSNDLYCIKGDANGNIWIGTANSGLLQTRYEDGKPLSFQRYLRRNFNESFIPDLDIDTKGRLWVATSNGLYMVGTHVEGISDEAFKVFNTAHGNFPYNDVVLVKCTTDGYVWTGTNGSGLQRNQLSVDQTHFDTRSITMREGLANNTVNAVIETGGKLWVATDYGYSTLAKKDLRAITRPLSRETKQNITVTRCATRLADGNVAFGTLNGIAVVSTASRTRPAIGTCEPRVTDLLVNGQSLLAAESRFTLADGLRLPHNSNSLTFRFSNFDFAARRHNLYQYYLEGLDKSWREPTSMNSVDYASLSPGRYRLHVRASGPDNKWGRETTFTVIIRHPWYNTWWAWIIYLAIIAAAAYYVWRNWKQKFDLRQSVKMEKQLTEFRLNFFTHITHEFRTPLAIIQGAVDKLTTPDGTRVSTANAQTAKRGVRRLLRLVNQLLQFRRISTDNIRLEVEREDIIAFVRDIYQDFWSVAKQKEQNITFSPFERSYEMLFDRHIVETVVYNILSNAVKYTPAKGNITLTIRKASDGMQIICEDSGPGISEEQKGSLFKPFMHGYVSQGGMGIGLYNAHEMAARHHGDLQYADATPTGSVFTFTLPADDNVYTADEYRSSLAVNAEGKEEEKAELVIHELKPEALNDIRIAIIEDDPDMMMQLKTEMSTYFHVDAYMDGKSGFEGVQANRPALLVCDVMLPDMNGYDIVKKLKKSEDFYDIPVIMLTALDDDRNKLKGYEAGADDYMVKPCNFKLLVARTVQLITWYKKMKASAKSTEVTEQKPVKKVETVIAKPGGEEDKIITSIADRNFLTKVQAIVAQHISDRDFTIDDLASMVNMGRTKFYGKIKDLLGMSPNKYLNRERMRIAGELVLEGELTVAEIGYRVGINDPTYFNKCFKAYYGCTPGKYRKQEY